MTLQFTETAPGVHTGSVTDPRTNETHNVAIIESCDAWQVFVDGEPKYRDLPSFREAVATIEQSASASKRSFPIVKLATVVASFSLLGAGSFAAAKFLDTEAAGLGQFASKATPAVVVERSTSKPTRIIRVNYAAQNTNSAYAPTAERDTTSPSAYSAGKSLLGPKAETPDLTGQPSSPVNADPSVETSGSQSTSEPFKPRLVPMETAPSSGPVAVAVPSLQDLDRDDRRPEPSLMDPDGSDNPRRKTSQPLPVARPANAVVTAPSITRSPARPSTKAPEVTGVAARAPLNDSVTTARTSRPSGVVVRQPAASGRDQASNDKKRSRRAAFPGRIESGAKPVRNLARSAPATTMRKPAGQLTRMNSETAPKPRKQSVRLPVQLKRADRKSEKRVITIAVQPGRKSASSQNPKKVINSLGGRSRTVRRKETGRAHKVSHKRSRARVQRKLQIKVKGKKIKRAHKKTVRRMASKPRKSIHPVRKLHRVRKPVRAVRKPIRRYRKSVRAFRQPAKRHFQPRHQPRMVCVGHTCKFR